MSSNKNTKIDEVVSVKSNRFIFVFRVVIILALIALSAISTMATFQFGFIGILQQAFQNSATIQIFLDLFISISLILTWIWFDAKKHHRKFLPWVVLSLALGSYGPLLYLLFRKREHFN